MLRRREPAMKATQLTRMAIISTKDVHQATLLWDVSRGREELQYEYQAILKPPLRHTHASITFPPQPNPNQPHEPGGGVFERQKQQDFGRLKAVPQGAIPRLHHGPRPAGGLRCCCMSCRGDERGRPQTQHTFFPWWPTRSGPNSASPIHWTRTLDQHNTIAYALTRGRELRERGQARVGTGVARRRGHERAAAVPAQHLHCGERPLDAAHGGGSGWDEMWCVQ